MATGLMNWFWIALASSALWSATNHIDKYLISRYFKQVGVATLVIFSSLIWVIGAVVIFIFKPDVVFLNLFTALLIVANGALYILAIIPYLAALKRDEVSVVAALFQLIPVMVYVLGVFILGEVLSTEQLAACGVIVGGAVFLSLELGGGKVRLKKEVLGLMVLSTFLFAINFTLFKYFALDESFWTTQFWQMVGSSLVGIIILVFFARHRSNFVRIFKANKLPVIGLNVINEALNVIALLAFTYATLLAPIALVQVVGGFEPVFVFVYGLLLTVFLPGIGDEKIAKKDLAQKIIAIAIMLVGTYVLLV